MKLSAAKIVRPIRKIVQLKVVGSDEEIPVGIRVGTVSERTEIYRRAMESAKKRGAEKWDLDDPICGLELYVETVAALAIDSEQIDADHPECFATADELRDDGRVGQENILFLYEAIEAFEQEHSIRPQNMNSAQLMEFCWNAAGDDNSFLDRLRLGMLRAYVRFLAVQYLDYMNLKLRLSTASSSATAPTSDKASRT